MVDVSTDQKKSLDLADLQYFEYSCDPMEMDDVNNGVRCSICLELLDKSDLVYALPSCMHIFHVQCLLTSFVEERIKMSKLQMPILATSSVVYLHACVMSPQKEYVLVHSNQNV